MRFTTGTNLPPSPVLSPSCSASSICGFCGALYANINKKILLDCSRGIRIEFFFRLLSAHSPVGRKKVTDGYFDLGLKVRHGGPDALKSIRDAEDKWSKIRDSVMGRTQALNPFLLQAKTFREFTEEIWEPTKEAGWKETTAGQWPYRKKRLFKAFANTPVNEMNFGSMQRFLNDLAAQGRSEDMLKHAIIDLRRILALAVKKGAPAENPAEGLKLPPETKPVKRPYLPYEQFEKVLAELPTFRDRLMARILYLCALRRQEFFGLVVGDFDGTRINVERQWSDRLKKKLSVKTKASRAKVMVPDELQKDLADWIKFTNISPDAWLFESKRRTPINSKNWLDRILKPAAQRAGVGPINYQMFRRGFATEAHLLGSNDKSIQGQLRHANPDISRRVYMQVVEQAQRSVAR